jgi:hypothetical protein
MASVGKDLAAIRQHLGYTVDDIHAITKIPINTINSIEKGSIFTSGEENPTYVRSFVRSYARAIKISDDLVVKALDQQNYGNYNHLLLNKYPELMPSGTVLSAEDEDSTAPPVAEPDNENEAVANIKDPSTYTSTPEPPTVSTVNWADMGQRFNVIDNRPPVWLIGAAIILIVALASGYFIINSDLFLSDEDNSTIVSPPIDPPESPILNLDVNEPEQTEEPAILDGTLYLTLYAAYDVLDPVRVWSDLKPRIDPYWMDRGQAYNFEFRDTVRVSGQYTRMLLFVNGNLIENPRQNHFNSTAGAIEITRSFLESDPKWTSEVPLELPPNAVPPDSVVNRPRF